MSNQATPPSFLACIPHAIEPHWDNVWAPRLAGFPVNIVYAARIEGVGLAEATYVFDPGTFIEGEQTRQMRCRDGLERHGIPRGRCTQSSGAVATDGPCCPPKAPAVLRHTLYRRRNSPCVAVPPMPGLGGTPQAVRA